MTDVYVSREGATHHENADATELDLERYMEIIDPIADRLLAGSRGDGRRREVKAALARFIRFWLCRPSVRQLLDVANDGGDIAELWPDDAAVDILRSGPVEYRRSRRRGHLFFELAFAPIRKGQGRPAAGRGGRSSRSRRPSGPRWTSGSRVSSRSGRPGRPCRTADAEGLVPRNWMARRIENKAAVHRAEPIACFGGPGMVVRYPCHPVHFGIEDTLLEIDPAYQLAVAREQRIHRGLLFRHRTLSRNSDDSNSSPRPGNSKDPVVSRAFVWSEQLASNQRPAVYRTAALPLSYAFPHLGSDPEIRKGWGASISTAFGGPNRPGLTFTFFILLRKSRRRFFGRRPELFFGLSCKIPDFRRR